MDLRRCGFAALLFDTDPAAGWAGAPGRRTASAAPAACTELVRAARHASHGLRRSL